MTLTFATAGDVLLREVLERPADDSPRLILADWLDERGDEARAEFALAAENTSGLTALRLSQRDFIDRISGPERVSLPPDGSYATRLVRRQVMSEYHNLPAPPEQDGIEFRHVKDYPGYGVGADGRVISCRKQVAIRGQSRAGFATVVGDVWRELRPTPMKNGYLRVVLRRGSAGRSVAVHQLVATAFLGPCPDGHEAAHENGNRLDNRAANLRWKTPQANQADRVRHGTAPHVPGHGPHKLRLSEAMIIWREINDGTSSATELSRRFNISRREVGRIARGETWKHARSG